MFRKIRKFLIPLGIVAVCLWAAPYVIRFGIDQLAANTKCFFLSSEEAAKPAIAVSGSSFSDARGGAAPAAGSKYQVVDLPSNHSFVVYPWLDVGAVEVRERRTGRVLLMPSTRVAFSQSAECR